MIVLPITGSFTRGQSSDSIPDGSGVLIVDELGPPNGYPMPSSIIDTIKASGIQVVHISGLTVGGFRSLSSLHYQLILLRVHSAADAIAMSQTYSTFSYVGEQLNDGVGAMTLSHGVVAFTVTSKFVANEMSGTFRSSSIVMFEGCSSLADTRLAEAFIKRGAGAFVGWEGGATLYHADLVSVRVIEKLLVEKEALGRSVTEIMEEVGPDPVTGASLSYYPSSASSISMANN